MKSLDISWEGGGWPVAEIFVRDLQNEFTKSLDELIYNTGTISFTMSHACFPDLTFRLPNL